MQGKELWTRQEWNLKAGCKRAWRQCGRELETRLGRARDAQCVHACIDYANYGISEL